MAGTPDLKRFIDAQQHDYELAFAEVSAGRNAAIGCGIFFRR